MLDLDQLADIPQQPLQQLELTQQPTEISHQLSDDFQSIKIHEAEYKNFELDEKYISEGYIIAKKDRGHIKRKIFSFLKNFPLQHIFSVYQTLSSQL